MSQPTSPESKVPPLLEAPLDKAVKEVAMAVAEWEAKQTPEHIKAQVFKLLDQHKEDMAMKLLGFRRNNFDKSWEIDFSSKSQAAAVHSAIEKLSQEAIAEYLALLRVPAISDKLKRRMESDAKNYFEGKLLRKVGEEAQNMADGALNEILSQLGSSNTFDKYQKMLGLLRPPMNNETQPNP
jgi:hypothetical protein